MKGPRRRKRAIIGNEDLGAGTLLRLNITLLDPSTGEVTKEIVMLDGDGAGTAPGAAGDVWGALQVMQVALGVCPRAQLVIHTLLTPYK